MGSLPNNYLGLPWLAGFKVRSVWLDLIEKFRFQLGHWKKIYLTKAGCLVLINSTLTFPPVYMLSNFMAPSSVIEELERILRSFLWGSCGEKSSIHYHGKSLLAIKMGWSWHQKSKRDQCFIVMKMPLGIR